MKKISIALFLVPLTVFGTISEDACAWGSVNLKYQAFDWLSLHAREETWMRDAASELDQWYMRFWMMFKVCPWFSIGPGYDYLEARTNHDAAGDFRRPKNNFFAQAVGNWKFGDFGLNIRERYVYGRQCVHVAGAHDGVHPAKPADLNSDLSRTRFRLDYTISEDCIFKPFVYEEIFLWRRPTQTRSAIGLSFKVTKNFGFDVLYIRQSKYHTGRDRNNNIASLDLNFSF